MPTSLYLKTPVINISCTWLALSVCAGLGELEGLTLKPRLALNPQGQPQPPKHWAFRHAVVPTSAPALMLSNIRLVVSCVKGYVECHLATISRWPPHGKVGSDPQLTPHSRFQGRDWIRPNDRGHSIAELQKVPVEAVDASGCAINYQGLSNLCEWPEWVGFPLALGSRKAPGATCLLTHQCP